MNTTYQLRSAEPIACSLIPSPLYRFRDAASPFSWESFDIGQLPDHFANGLTLFQERIDKLQDPSYIVSTKERQQLFFMLEELLYVRGLITDLEQKRR